MALARRASHDTRSGGRGVEIHGLTEFRRQLRLLGPEWTRELKKVNVEVGEHAAEWARGGAQNKGGVQAAAAYSIVGAGTATGARVRWGGRGYEFADGAFFGAKKYAQFPTWIGASWDTDLQSGEGPGKGPYGIGPAIGRRLDEIGDMYLDRLTDLARAVDAFSADPSLGDLFAD